MTIETSLNVFDAIVFAIFAVSCLHAFFRGFVREVLSLSAWLLAGVVTLYFFPSAAEYLQPEVKNSPVVAAGFSTLGIYTISLLGFSLFNTMLLKFIKSGTDVGLLDNTLGLIFGAFRAAVLICLIFFLMTISMPEDEYPKTIKTSVSLPHVEKGAIILAKYAPKYLREMSSLNKKIKAEEEKNKNTGGANSGRNTDIHESVSEKKEKENDQ